MKKDKTDPKFNSMEVEDAVTQCSEMRELISDTEDFFKEVDDESDDFDLENCNIDDDNSNVLSGVLSQFKVYYIRETDPDKILTKIVQARDQDGAKSEFYTTMGENVEITGIEEIESETEDDLAAFWADEDEEDDGEDYSEESPAYFYDPEWD